MTTISNRTRRPVSIPLPRGKTLHLGPGRTGEISGTAADHPGVKKLIEAGEIEIVGEGQRPTESELELKIMSPEDFICDYSPQFDTA